MCAFHVVREDFQARLRVDARPFAEQQVLVLLVGDDLLGVLVDDDAAAEHRPRPVCQNTLEVQVAVRVVLQVVDVDVVVDVLRAGGIVQAVQRAFRPRRVQQHVQVVAGDARAPRKRHRLELAVSLLEYPGHCNMERPAALHHVAIVIDLAAVLDNHFMNGVGEVLGLSKTDVAFD